MDNLLDKLIETDLFYFFIGCMISADHLIGLKECEDTLKELEQLEEASKTSKLKDDKIDDFLKKARYIIERDLEVFKNK